MDWLLNNKMGHKTDERTWILRGDIELNYLTSLSQTEAQSTADLVFCWKPKKRWAAIVKAGCPCLKGAKAIGTNE